jgi:hypothetical protein
MGHPLEAGAERVRDHLRRPVPEQLSVADRLAEAVRRHGPAVGGDR